MPNYDYDGFREVVMVSQSAALSGQDHRSSKNYLFTDKAFHPCSEVVWECESGITFDVLRDRSAATDDVIHTRICNGSKTKPPTGEGIYIANPKGAKGEFEIRLRITK